jgi:hypothetical protein
MAHNQLTTKTTDVQSTDAASPDNRTATSEYRRGMMGCGMGKKGLKGMLLMAACCGAPLLLLLALPLAGSALGAFGVSALNILAVLACPIGMALMVWMMMRAQQAGLQQAVQELPAGSQTASTTPVAPQEGAIRSDITEIREVAVIPPLQTQEKVTTPPRSANDHQQVQPTPAVNGHQTVPQPLGKSGTQVATLPEE